DPLCARSPRRPKMRTGQHARNDRGRLADRRVTARPIRAARHAREGMMRIFGYNVSFTKARQPTPTQPPMVPGWSGSWWWPASRDRFAGVWQRIRKWGEKTCLTFSAFLGAVSLISPDVGKRLLKPPRRDSDEIWKEITSPAFSPVLRKPNHYQTRQKFIE